MSAEACDKEGLASEHLKDWGGWGEESRTWEGLQASSSCRREPVAGGGSCSFSSYNRAHGSVKDQFQGSIHCRVIRDSMCFGELAIAQAKAETCTVSSN